MNHKAEIINTRFTKSVINSKVGTDLTIRHQVLKLKISSPFHNSPSLERFVFVPMLMKNCSYPLLTELLYRYVPSGLSDLR